MFGIDLEREDFVWLNVAKDGWRRVAAESSTKFLLNYFNMVDVFNVYDLFTMLATEVVDNPAEADVVVTDQAVEIREDAELVRSYDIEKILAYLNS